MNCAIPRSRKNSPANSGNRTAPDVGKREFGAKVSIHKAATGYSLAVHKVSGRGCRRAAAMGIRSAAKNTSPTNVILTKVRIHASFKDTGASPP